MIFDVRWSRLREADVPFKHKAQLAPFRRRCHTELGRGYWGEWPAAQAYARNPTSGLNAATATLGF